MAIDGIQITLGELTQVSGNIRTLNSSLTTCLEEIKAQMNALANDWSSESSETIRSKFNAHAAHFEEYRTVIDSYAKFLDNTVTAYDTAETSINSNANSFK